MPVDLSRPKELDVDRKVIQQKEIGWAIKEN